MDYEQCANSVTTIIKSHWNATAPDPKQMTVPVTFTHDRKIAAGCVVFVVEADGSYEAKAFDSRYPLIDQTIRDVYHAAYFECDDYLDKVQPLMDAVAAKLK